MTNSPGRYRLIACILPLVLPLAAAAQTAVTLSPTASPAAGQPGITTINLTGSNFPAGTIQPSAVTVSLQPSAGGTSVTTPASAVTTIVGATKRITFTIPASISVSSPTAYAVSITGATTANAAFASSNTAALTINPAPQILSVAPATGTPGQTESVTITAAYTNFVQGSTTANFGAGITVGTIAVSSATTLTAQLTISPTATPGPRDVTVSTGVQTATLAAGFTIASVGPVIADFNPKSGPISTIVVITGNNFGTAPTVTMPGLSGSPISLPVQSVSSSPSPAGSSVTIVIPAGAATGPITVANSGLTATTSLPFTVTPASTFTISAAPATANLIVGQTVTVAVQLASSNGFNQVATLTVSGVPSGVTASFNPSSITAGQTSVLTLTAPASQPVSTATLSLSASATVNGIAETQSASATLAIQGATTSFLGRTVVANSTETPLVGVTVIACARPVPKSLASMLTTPFASSWNVT